MVCVVLLFVKLILVMVLLVKWGGEFVFMKG